jgi:hypothetical protein
VSSRVFIKFQVTSSVFCAVSRRFDVKRPEVTVARKSNDKGGEKGKPAKKPAKSK